MNIDFNRVEFDDSNPEPRCPCILLLDTSASMEGKPIFELNAGLHAFRDSLLNDTLAMLRVEIAIITFGPVKLTQEFISASQFVAPTLHANDGTPMGEAINLALDKLDERKQIYKQKGITYYRPWVFMITDGAPNSDSPWREAAKRVYNAEKEKKVAFFSVGVEDADLNVLGQISPRQALKLKGLNFREMFLWLSSSLSSVSRSKPTEEVPLQSPIGWSTV